MEFILEYDNEEYLILTDEFSKKDKTEVIRVPYSDEEGDWVEYEIQVFKRKGNKFFKEKVLELPEELRNVIGKNIQELLDRTFIANPYFDDLLIFFEKKEKPFGRAVIRAESCHPSLGSLRPYRIQ